MSDGLSERAADRGVRDMAGRQGSARQSQSDAEPLRSWLNLQLICSELSRIGSIPHKRSGLAGNISPRHACMITDECGGKMARSVALRSDSRMDAASIPRSGPRSALRTARNGAIAARYCATGGCAAKGRALRAARRREIEPRVGGAHAGLGQAEFAAHDVGALDQRRRICNRRCGATGPRGRSRNRW